MSGFTKLVPEIIQSSIWNETSDIRIVWITMLATKDENGYVQGDARTIGRLANVPTDQAEEALRIFQTPDPSSKTPDNDGRRIMPAPGGWLILNHQIYRVRDDDVQRQKTRERVRRYRERQDVTQCNVTETLPSASVSVSSSVSSPEGDCKGEATFSSLDVEFGECWSLYPDKTGKSNAKKDYIKARKSGTTQEQVLSGINRYIAYIRHRQATDFPDLKFANGSTWFHQKRWEDECKIAQAPARLNPNAKPRIDL